MFWLLINFRINWLPRSSSLGSRFGWRFNVVTREINSDGVQLNCFGTKVAASWFEGFKCELRLPTQDNSSIWLVLRRSEWSDLDSISKSFFFSWLSFDSISKSIFFSWLFFASSFTRCSSIRLSLASSWLSLASSWLLSLLISRSHSPFSLLCVRLRSFSSPLIFITYDDYSWIRMSKTICCCIADSQKKTMKKQYLYFGCCAAYCLL